MLFQKDLAYKKARSSGLSQYILQARTQETNRNMPSAWPCSKRVCFSRKTQLIKRPGTAKKVIASAKQSFKSERLRYVDDSWTYPKVVSMTDHQYKKLFQSEGTLPTGRVQINYWENGSAMTKAASSSIKTQETNRNIPSTSPRPPIVIYPSYPSHVFSSRFQNNKPRQYLAANYIPELTSWFNGLRAISEPSLHCLGRYRMHGSIPTSLPRALT